MRICIDLDGTICELRSDDQAYADIQPKPGAVDKIQKLKEHGHFIIIYTARHMKTCNGNVGMVVARQGKVTLEWLSRHNVPFDEIWFGKPYADVYIDDNAFRFNVWHEINSDGSNLPRSSENRKRNESNKEIHRLDKKPK